MKEEGWRKKKAGVGWAVCEKIKGKKERRKEVKRWAGPKEEIKKKERKDEKERKKRKKKKIKIK